jgi:hypothetical protein
VTSYVYESPDGGGTIYRRRMGENPAQRELITSNHEPRSWHSDLKHTALWHGIHLASAKDPVLKDMLDQIEVYYHLQNSP